VTDATALRRFGTPEEIADIVYALASPLTRWVTAQTIDASDGFRL
jgi:3-oxoacyl-[acyl-carrier protein] reductase